MARIYNVAFKNVSVSAVQDLFGLYGNGKALRIHGVSLGQVGQSAVQNLNISFKRLSATITNGSGGTTPTPRPAQPTDTAATFLAHCNDTTQATSATLTEIMLADAFNIINGYLHLPPAEDRIVILPTQALIVSLDTAPSGSCAVSGTATVEELF